MLTRLVSRLVLNDLCRSFSEIRLVGDVPDLPRNMPAVLYANHHGFHDGYLGWYAVTHLLNRHFMTWMREWYRYPLFAPLGALPFPEDKPARRIETIRRTAQRLRHHRQSALLYFPEGRLHAHQEGVLPFEQHPVERLSRILAPSIWMPLSLYVTSWGDPRPVALLSFGDPRPGADGTEHDRLEQVWDVLRATAPQGGQAVLTGRRNAHERWNLKPLAGYFERFL